MNSIRNGLVLACLVAGPLTAQTVVTVDEARSASRLMFVSGLRNRQLRWLGHHGTKFDSSFARKQATAFALDAVIKGWQEGITKMKQGAIFRFEIPPKLAYGKRGAGAIVGPNATLVFWIELLKF